MISHFHRTVFVHIPKCGGQSIESAFLADLGLNWELRAPLLLRPNDEPRLGPPRLAHLLASDYTRYHYISDELLQSYYSFSIMRDPVARVVSLFNYMKIMDAEQRLLDMDSFLFRWLPQQLAFAKASEVQQNASTNSFHFVRPQVDFVTGRDGSLLVKDVFYLEQLADTFPAIQARANLRSSLEHRNKSVPRITMRDLNASQIAFIQNAYADDVAFMATHRPSI